ncbi:MAG: Mur ligase family protein [Bacteroidetes bacterium]|nr:Mur ligase family protein [Bacteroidota bacterium]MDA0903647.1 Mur ligase family protein [Bacteroidota bacterium]MDA1242599.1 Mur ligase family protein [Bacteroidota bacterium]
MRIHLIAIGGSAMHNFALALADSGHDVTGSDDQIFEPSRSRLDKAGLLPEMDGWHPDRLNPDIDIVILGMHARTDNPELLRAQEMGLTIQSYPEFLRFATRDKKRMVIAGSHGKTTVTSMILHAMKGAGQSTDLMVGAQLEGFDRMVHLDPHTEWAVIEGDEYLSSPIDPKPKFLWYGPHVTVITGIAWDHVNVFPTEEDYIAQFSTYLLTVEHGGTVVHCTEDKLLARVIAQAQPLRPDIRWIGYQTPPHHPTSTGSEVTLDGTKPLAVSLLGAHNMQNLAAARACCVAMGMDAVDFDAHMTDFTGAARRLEMAHESNDFVVFRDFAHAPSKLRATQASVVGQFPDREVTAVFELHTFSSLNKDFLPQYHGSMDAVDHAVVYFDPDVVAHKRLPSLDAEFVRACFGRTSLEVITDQAELNARLQDVPQSNHVLLMMSSGRFGGVNIIPNPRPVTSSQ